MKSDLPATTSRRRFLARAATLGLAAPFGVAAGRSLALPRAPLPFDPHAFPICRAAATGDAVPSGEMKKISFAWNAGAPCLLAVTVAKDKGFFAKHGLDVDLVNYAGSTDQLLETLATGKADAAVGMALRWLKPMEQGFDVKIIASLHGGCMRLLAPADSAINQVSDLKGKTIAVSDMNSPSKNFFSIVIHKAGLDPTTDVEFKQFPAPLLRAAVDKGEAHAVADGDPNTYLWLKDGKLKEISSNLSNEYAHRVCCIVACAAASSEMTDAPRPRSRSRCSTRPSTPPKTRPKRRRLTRRSWPARCPRRTSWRSRNITPTITTRWATI
jgi:NitT/TauT family transport system substrate-binding protein